MSPDAVNACFELFGGAMLWLNVRRLLLDREVRGISVIPVALYALWSVWGLFYYAGLGHTASMWACAVGGAAKFSWLAVFVKVKYWDGHWTFD